jgi:PKD repeat protein
LHIDSLSGMPTGFSYVVNPASGTVLGGGNGVICYSGTTNDTVGPYPITFYGDIYTNAGLIPFSYLVTLAPSFSYKFRVETAPVASFTIDSPLCSNDTVKFIDHTTGYPTHWAWVFTGGTPATSTAQFPAVVYDSAGTYPVRFIGRNSISSDTIYQSVTVYPGVTGSVSVTPASGSASATGAAAVTAGGGTPPYSYFWSDSATSSGIANVLPGTYGLSVTDTKGCQYVNDTIHVTFINGIMELGASQQVKVYPNPASDVLNLSWSQKPNAEVSIIDMNGNVIQTVVAAEMQTVCNIHSLAPGTYVLRVTDKTSNQQQSMLFSKF